VKYAEYRFLCTFESDAMLSRHKGSGIRGLFGHCLKKVACAQRQSDCRDCLLNGTCVYFQIFESPAVAAGSRIRNTARPHPFVLVPPGETGKRDFSAGEGFEMRFKLFGYAIGWLPYIVFTVEQMGKVGLGARHRKGFGKFRLDFVKCGECGENIIYSHETRMLEPIDCWQELDVSKIAVRTTESVKIFYMMPLRLKSRNRLVTESIDFQTLIRACCRRISSLEEAFGNGEPDIDYSGLVRDAANIETVKSDIRWERVPRYSNRQRARMNIGGIVGKVEYEGDITPYWPLLKYCEAVHIGKQTAFGNGRIAVVDK
jgi:hypothetical protein